MPVMRKSGCSFPQIQMSLVLFMSAILFCACQSQRNLDADRYRPPELDIGTSVTVIYPGEQHPQQQHRGGIISQSDMPATSKQREHEEQLQQKLEEELAQRNTETERNPTALPAAEGNTQPPLPSIAQELALLQERLAQTQRAANPAPTSNMAAASASALPLKRSQHRDSNGESYERLHEDLDEDGEYDSWSDYRNEQLLRQKQDSNGDGTVDQWSFYQEGVITRHEEDTRGEGFRTRVSYFKAGRLTRSEDDMDGNGKAELIRFFDQDEKLREEHQDLDHDGWVDVRSHYQAGRLLSRELLGAGELGLQNTTGGLPALPPAMKETQG